MTERHPDSQFSTPGGSPIEPGVNDSALLRAIQEAHAAGRAEGFREGKLRMKSNEETAELKTEKHPNSSRWNDHWQVRILIGIVLFFIATFTPGGLWIVSRAVANESKNVEQDERLKKSEERWVEYREEQKRQGQILEDIRREVKK